MFSLHLFLKHIMFNKDYLFIYIYIYIYTYIYIYIYNKDYTFSIKQIIPNISIDSSSLNIFRLHS